MSLGLVAAGPRVVIGAVRFQPWPSGRPSSPRCSVGPPHAPFPAPHNARSPLCRMPLAAVGYLDGTLAIYDLSTQTLRHKCQHEVLPYALSPGLSGSEPS